MSRDSLQRGVADAEAVGAGGAELLVVQPLLDWVFHDKRRT
jgi:hypothetical protein